MSRTPRLSVLCCAVVLTICLVAGWCVAAKQTDSHRALAKSLQTWKALKARCGGNYSYKVRFVSWVGFGNETEIVVRDNKVAERRYREWSGRAVAVPVPGQPPKPQGKTWTERGKELGSHKKGAPLKTLDELYAQAKAVLDAGRRPHQKLYVRYDKQGLLLSCFTVDTRIADDAPRKGVAITSITPGEADKDAWEVLFDGKDLAAWNVDPKAGVWAISKQGELYPAKGGPTIFTRRRYCDFVLELDFKMAAKAKSNSGVFIRVHDPRHEVYTGMEIQILDNADYRVGWNAMNANGALYGLAQPAVDANKPMGQWNHFRITANDGLITVELNGKQIVNADLNKWTTPRKNPDGRGNKFPHAIGSLPREGFIGLQNYGGKALWFRNVRIKPLSNRKPKHTGKEPIADVLVKPKRR